MTNLHPCKYAIGDNNVNPFYCQKCILDNGQMNSCICQRYCTREKRWLPLTNAKDRCKLFQEQSEE